MRTPRTEYELGLKLFAEKSFDEAYACFERAQQDASLRSDAVLSMGLASLARGRYDQARALLTEAVALTPNPGAMYYLGATYRRLLNAEMAAYWWRRVLLMEPDNERALKAMNELGYVKEVTDDVGPTKGVRLNKPTTEVKELDSLAALIDSSETTASEFSGEFVRALYPVARAFQARLIVPALLFLMSIVSVFLSASSGPLAALLSTIPTSNPAVGLRLAVILYETARVSLAVSILILVVALATVRLSARSRVYLVYERRLESIAGLISQTARTVWFYEVQASPVVKSGMVGQLTGTASIFLKLESDELVLRGLTLADATATTDYLRRRVLVERRQMVDKFITR